VVVVEFSCRQQGVGVDEFEVMFILPASRAQFQSLLLSFENSNERENCPGTCLNPQNGGRSGGGGVDLYLPGS
jgi:hypothetical protein